MSAGMTGQIDGPVIVLRSGAYFDLARPDPASVDIEDIAHALSLLCRFTGHCPRFYSVAQHSWEMSWNIASEHALAALLHDASEAYLGDVSAPLKALPPEYRALEERVQRAIAERFSLPWPFPEEVKRADLRMLATERRDLLQNDDDWSVLRGVAPFDSGLDGREDPALWRKFFLRRFHQLGKPR
jgi:hypothetical protein